MDMAGPQIYNRIALYYWIENSLLLFGSELKSILSYGIISKKINLQSFHEFLYYGYALGENTLFAGIKKLLPGQYLEIGQDKVVVVKSYLLYTSDAAEERSSVDLGGRRIIKKKTHI